MKLLSLFDGSGGFPLAGCLCGITPVAAAEVEPYPIAVTRSRFPNMKHLGDVSKVHGRGIEPVDIITFGSPCQDMSVAGKRAGLKHEENGDNETTRSGLFMEAIRIIYEMREATNGVYPRYAIWENVPGAFTSNRGEDFRRVLEEFVKLNEPAAVMPDVPKRGWSYFDCYHGDGWSLAYRTFDAQYWGVPQRRRRIYLVADFRGQRAAEILFKPGRLRGYFEKGRTQEQKAAGNAKNSAGTNDREGSKLDAITFEPGILRREGAHIYEGKAGTIRANAGDNQLAVAYGLDLYNLAVVAASLTTATGQGAQNTGPSVCLEEKREQYIFENHALDSRYNGPLPKSPTLQAALGTGGNNAPLVVEEELPVDCLQGNGIDRADTAGCNGKGWREDVGYTLNTIDRPAVAYAMNGFGGYKESDISSTIKARDYKNAKFDPQLYQDGTCPTLVARGPAAVAVKYIVRRLTPTECARLQGFPDLWGHPDKKDDFTDEEYKFWLDVRNTHATINGRKTKEYTKAQMLTWYSKLYTDSSEYKMWGNGIALPNALYVMQGIVEERNEEKKVKEQRI